MVKTVNVLVQQLGAKPIDTAPRGDGETLRLVLEDERIVAGCWNHERKSWAWLNGHSHICYSAENTWFGSKVIAWAPLYEGQPLPTPERAAPGSEDGGK